MKSYDVKFWAIRPGKAKTRRTYEIRWKVGHTPHSSTLGNKAQADNFLSDLRRAARERRGIRHRYRPARLDDHGNSSGAVVA